MSTFLPLLIVLTVGQQEPSQNLPDKVGQMVRFEVLVADLAEPANEPTAAEILELEKTRKLKSLMRFQLASLEEQPGFVQIGQTVSRTGGPAAAGPAAGARRGGPGGAPPFGAPATRYSDVNVGTIMHVTPRIEKDGSIAAKLAFFRTALTDKPSAENDQAATPPQGIDRLTVQTTLHLKAGEPQIVGTKQAGPGQEGSATWVVITAHVGAEK